MCAQVRVGEEVEEVKEERRRQGRVSAGNRP